MKKTVLAVVCVGLLNLIATKLSAQEKKSEGAASLALPVNAPQPGQTAPVAPLPPIQKSAVTDWLGITLTSQFAGPALEFSPKNETTGSGVGAAPPSSIGTPITDGYASFNLVSFRFKNLIGSYALDVQTRFRLIFNDDRFQARRSHQFQTFRWESPRFGISGRLLAGETWALTGAVNTDLPYTFPEPFSGFQARGRTLIATPGVFANLRWAPIGSKFSFFSIIGPRFLIYEDRNAAEPEFLGSGLSGDMKPEFGIQVWPALNYKISEIFDLSVGTALTFEKQVQSDWNPFVGTTRVLNEKSNKWRMRSIPLNFGVTYNLSKEFRIFPFVSFYPIESMRENAKGQVADFLKTACVGLEVTGILF